ncbi:type VI secretion system membrane subunit TssM [Aquabacter sp. CN5-332]|uniref:type VI secretion system membrane subunit TssM n=1 Tax=Aquabacter sp. CN5-332 TaxID=3156608 RepID=UPI0032B33996
MPKFLTTWKFWRWVILAAVTLALLLVMWFVGPFVAVGSVAPLASIVARLLVCFVILLGAGILGVIWLLGNKEEEVNQRQDRQSLALASQIADSHEIPKAQRDTMERGFQLTMAMLHRIRPSGFFGKRYKYALPWYGVIGGEGAGKSSFIHSSDLRFPLNEAREGRINAGTVHFSFTDRAVLVETRGPLVTAPEPNTWGIFATLLKRYRPRQPINGIILTLNLAEMLRANDVQRFSFNADLREQLEFFQRTLKLRVPIYMVLAKADQLAGFSEFCADLTQNERRGVFGITLPLYDEQGQTNKGKSLAATFAAEYDNFLQWQMPRMLSQVNQTFRVDERFDCFMFIPQLATLKPLIADLIDDVFKPTTFERPLLLRGVYFTSSGHAAARNEGEVLALPSVVDEMADARRTGLFIHDLLDKVIFKESGLVEHDPVSQRRARTFRWSAAGAGIATAVLLVSWWVTSFIGNSYLVTDIRYAAQRAKDTIAQLDVRLSNHSASETDMAAILPTLNALESLPTGWIDGPNPEVPFRLSGGLSQTHLLSTITRQEYVDTLQVLLQPRIHAALQSEIIESMNSPSGLYSALKVYLMLGGAGPMDDAAVLDWMKRYFVSVYPGPAQAPLRSALLDHVSNLLAAKVPPIELDHALVVQARTALDAYSPANRGMAVLQQMPDIQQLAPWRLTDVTGPLAPYALVRRSGRPLSEPIAGLYTSEAFFDIVLPAIAKIAVDLAEEDWVRMPNNSPAAPNLSRTEQLRRDMTDLYVNDYISTWQTLISDVTIAPFDSLQAEISVLQSLLGPPSPLSSYLQAVMQQTTLAPATKPAGDGKVAAATAALADLSSATSRLRTLGASVTGHFSDLHRFVAGSPSPLDEVLKSLSQLRALLGPAASVGGNNPTQVTDLSTGPAYQQVLSQLKLNTLSAPPALTDSILGLVRQTSSITDAGVRTDLDAAWQSQVLPFCQVAINGKYPFASSNTDVTLADFTRMFGPDGLLDKFFDRQLKPFVDTISSPWRPLANAGARTDITALALGYFEQAAKIRTFFFAPGTTAPQVAFSLTPRDLDPGAMRVKLDIDGQSISYQYGPPHTVQMKWPGNVGGVRVEFGAASEGQPSSLTYDGPWALFRFLAARSLKRESANRFVLNINLGERSASFNLDAASVNNPFQKSPLTGFRCLSSLVR